MYNHVNALHLCPLPLKVPIAEFSDVTIAFTCCQEFDRQVWEAVCKLYGINVEFTDGTTQYLVVFPLEKPDLINKSAKI